MDNDDIKMLSILLVPIAVVLVVLISCITYFNITKLKQAAEGEPMDAVMYIHKLDDRQFVQLIHALKTNTDESKQN